MKARCLGPPLGNGRARSAPGRQHEKCRAPMTGGARKCLDQQKFRMPAASGPQIERKSASAGVTAARVAVGMPHRIAASVGRLAFPIAIGSDPEQTFDPADRAANHPADNPPDRARGVISDISATGGACGNALRLRRKR